MKILKVKVGFIALFAALMLSAFTYAAKQQNKPAVADEVLFWFEEEAALNYVQQNTVLDEKAANCPGVTTPCEYGYKADDFNTSGNPFSGLKTGHGAPEIIHIN